MHHFILKRYYYFFTSHLSCVEYFIDREVMSFSDRCGIERIIILSVPRQPRVASTERLYDERTAFL